MTDNLIYEMASDFNPIALREISRSAELRYDLLNKNLPPPWKRTKRERDAVHNFMLLANSAKAVADIVEEAAENERA